MDLQVTAYGPQQRGNRTETPSDHRYNSANNFQGVKNAVEKQLPSAVPQTAQMDGSRLQKQGGLFIDEETRRVYYKLRDPTTGSEERFPSEAQLRMVAEMKAELDRQFPSSMDDNLNLANGEILNTKV